MLEKKLTQKDKAIATIELAKYMSHKVKVYKPKDSGKGYQNEYIEPKLDTIAKNATGR